MSALSATPLTPAGGASTTVAHTYAAGAQQPSLAVIDAAIMQAVAAGDTARRDALMTTRAASAIGGILAALPCPRPAGPGAIADQLDRDSGQGGPTGSIQGVERSR